jgi:L-lactate dehydrogenase (cytochrome)
VDPASIVSAESQGLRDVKQSDTIPLSMILSLDDFEHSADRSMNRKAYTYYHSAADSLGAYNNNTQDWPKVLLRPRVLRNVQQVDMRCTMMGQRSNFPFFIAPAARAKLAHPDGEFCLARGAARAGIPYCTSTVSSTAHAQLATCLQAEKKFEEEGCLFFQLYAAVDRKTTVERIETAKSHGYKALVLTVDSAVVGKREEDERYKAELEWMDGEEIDTSVRVKQVGVNMSVLRGHHSSTLNWDDLNWIRELWGNTGPFGLKGIQTVEDAILAVEAGVNVIYLSNHGGRQADDAPSAIRTLVEIRKFAPRLLDEAEFYLDGSVRRGADIIKAICLGARGCSIGRSFMYAMGLYGTAGVEKAIKSEYMTLDRRDDVILMTC